MLHFDTILLIGSALILLSAIIARLSNNLGVPTIILFLGIGMIAGEDGLGGIQFSNFSLAQEVGIVALVVILFSGGLDTDWRHVRPVLAPALSLATLGVVVTAAIVAIFAHYYFGLDWTVSWLLGAVMSSTDAAAVFSVFRSRGIRLKGRLSALLELESGTNDPMAVFLTIGLIELMLSPEQSAFSLVQLFLVQMSIGALVGYLSGRALIYLMNNLRSPVEGIYPVASVSAALLVYALAATLGGSGFLAVYLAGLYLGNHDFIQRRGIIRFFEGLAWLAEIGMFLVLGLLVTPSKIWEVAGSGVLFALCLMFIARPVAVMSSLSVSSFSWREKLLVSWVGLRGAIPIILAIFPVLAGAPGAQTIFNLVFFVVVSSTLLQGWTVLVAARSLGLAEPIDPKHASPLDFYALHPSPTRLAEVVIPEGGIVSGRQIVELQLPGGTLIVLIQRAGEYIVPTGDTIFEPQDRVQILAPASQIEELRQKFLEVA